MPPATTFQLKSEKPADWDAIGTVVTSAFAQAPHNSGTEAAIVAALRRAGALTVSLVAEEDSQIIGHVAFSPVSISSGTEGWFGLGPVAVRPDRQMQGIGQALIRSGLDRLRALKARGCVVVGDPAYYGRFGFRRDPALVYTDVPAEYFQSLGFGADSPSGEVAYHPAFGES